MGVCGIGFGDKVLRLLKEGIWDPAHRVNNDIFLGVRFAGEFYFMLVMKARLPESFSSFACVMGGWAGGPTLPDFF